MRLSSIILPAIVAAVFLYGLIKRVDILDAFTEGARENLITAVRLIPTLTLLMLGVGMFRASGALEMITSALAPAARFIGLPPECLPLALLRPVSGSGALTILKDILNNCGPDSFTGRVASVLMGSTETTFYTVAVYFGATRTKKSRHALASALTGDFTALILSAVAVRLFLI